MMTFHSKFFSLKLQLKNRLISMVLYFLNLGMVIERASYITKGKYRALSRFCSIHGNS